jgi:thiamine biosynthesis lipoprotein
MLLQVRRRAMATTFQIDLPVGTPDAVAAATDALELVAELEAQLTVYRDDSEVSRLNAAGAAVVESRLFGLLQAAAAISQDTAGAFDCATGALVEAWGFRTRQGRVPEPAVLADARRASGSRHVVLDEPTRAVRFLRPGLLVNLGGIGKGYALDRAAERLQTRWGVGSALLHAGGSSVRAVGAPPGSPRGWGVAVKHPHREGKTLGTVWLRDQGFGTSAATFQHFEHNGKRYGHLLDPRTGVPAEGTASASCLAPTAAAADALSTAFFVLGAEAAVEHCRSRPGLGCVILADAADAPALGGGPPVWYDPPEDG